MPRHVRHEGPISLDLNSHPKCGVGAGVPLLVHPRGFARQSAEEPVRVK